MCIQIVRRPQSNTARRFVATPMADVGVSVVSVGELWVGSQRKNNPPTEADKLKRFLELVNIVPFDNACAKEFGRIAAALLDAGTPVGGLDVQIAATATVLGLTVVTRNIRHFAVVPALSIEDWEI